MIILFKLILLTSVWVLGVRMVTDKGMLLEDWRKWAENKHAKIYEAIVLCHLCMPSLHSSVGYLFGFGLGIAGVFEWKYLLLYPLVVMGSSMLNGIVWGVFKTFTAMSKYFENQNEIDEGAM